MAPGTIRMSADEKRVKILDIFHETKDFFQLKEIEKLASKRGVVEKTVKDIVQQLVADGLIQSDKIGASNFFWNFPSAQGATLNKQLHACQEEEVTSKARIQESQEAITNEQTERTDSPERQAALQEYQALQDQLSALLSETSAYSKCDPEHVAQKARAIFLAKEAALRWTDDVVLARTYFSHQLNMNAEEINQHFGIGIDFEDLE